MQLAGSLRTLICWSEAAYMFVQLVGALIIPNAGNCFVQK